MWLSSLRGSGNSHDFIIILSFLYEISRINNMIIRDILLLFERIFKCYRIGNL